MTLHLVGRSMPEEYEMRCQAAGTDLDGGRKPNSTYNSTVKVFRNAYDIYGGDGAARGPTDSFAMHLNSFLQADLRAEAGSIGAVASTIQTVVPASVQALPLWYRVIGKCMRFIPTQNLDSRAGTLIGAKNGAPIVGSNYTTLAQVREIPWAREGQADAGIHVDLAHGPIDHRKMCYFQGGWLGTVTDANIAINQIWDPDMFHWWDPATPATEQANNGNNNQVVPIGPTANQNMRMSETTGAAIIVGSGFDVGAALDVHLGRLEAVCIYDMINYTQLWQQKPISVEKSPSNVASRGTANQSDLQFIVHKAEGAGGWLARNWRSVAKTAASVGDTLATGASILGVPGAGAVAAGLDMLGGLF